MSSTYDEKPVLETLSASVSDMEKIVPSTAYLLNLPAEIQSLIWAQVDKTTTSPICKTLLPYQRSIIFKEINIRTRSSFDRLAPVLTRHFGPGCFVRTLSVKLGKKSLKGIRTKKIQELFKALPGVKEVQVSLKFAQVVLNEDTAKSSLANMSRLALFDPYRGQAAAQWNVEAYRVLGLYPSLLSQSLSLHNKPPVASSETPLVALPSFTKIKSFNLHGALDTVHAPLFVKSVPNIECLRLSTKGDIPVKFCAALEAAPTTLRMLKVEEKEHCHQVLGSEYLIDHSISRFTRLEKLVLATSYFSSNIFPYLKNPLPLKQIEFGPTAIHSINQVDIKNLMLLTSPTLNSSLKVIVLDVVHGAIGETTADDELDEEGFPVLEDWILPEWSYNRFDEDGMRVIKILGGTHGVRIKGTAVAALEVQDAWEEERFMAEDGWDEYEGSEIWEDEGRMMEMYGIDCPYCLLNPSGMCGECADHFGLDV